MVSSILRLALSEKKADRFYNLISLPTPKSVNRIWSRSIPRGTILPLEQDQPSLAPFQPNKKTKQKPTNQQQQKKPHKNSQKTKPKNQNIVKL